MKLSVQRVNCYVAIYNKTIDENISMLAINAPEPIGVNLKKLKTII